MLKKPLALKGIVPFLVPEQVPERGSKMAAKRRHWKEKNGRFWARLAVPVDLRTFFQNRTELIEPLGGDLRIADRNHSAAVARLHARIDEARQLLSSASPVVETAPTLRELGSEDREDAAWSHYTTSLSAIQQKRAALPTTDEIEAEHDRLMQRLDAGEADVGRNPIGMFNVYSDYELKAGARHFDRNLRTRRLAALRSAIASGETRFVANAVDEYVAAKNLTVERGSREWQELVHVFTRAEAEALQRTIEFDEGFPGGQPTDPLIRPPSCSPKEADRVPLKKLFDDYIASRQAVGFHRDGGANWEHPIKALTRFLGHSDARKITRLNLIHWRDSLLASGLSAKTVSDKHLAAVCAVLTWAFENARLPTNEAEKVKQDVPKQVRSREAGYVEKEAVLILMASRDYKPAPAVNPANRESAHITAAKRWIPLLCAFTGARVTEMTQLRKEDLRQEGDRWIIRITPEAGSVKSGQYRDVPLHRQVVGLGFIDFVNAAKPGPMFHGAMTAEKYLASARATSGRLSEWLQELNLVPEGVAPNYGWRHRFKTQGRELGMSDRVLDAIQGHPGKGASDGYGDVTIAAKLKIIDALADYELAADSPD